MNASTRAAALAALVASTSAVEAAVIDLDLLGQGGVRFLPGMATDTAFDDIDAPEAVGPSPMFDDASLVTMSEEDPGPQAIDGFIQGRLTETSPAFAGETSTVLFPPMSLNPHATMLPLSPARKAALLQGRRYLNLLARPTNTSPPQTHMAVPEPASASLAVFGFMAWALRRRRERQSVRR